VQAQGLRSNALASALYAISAFTPTLTLTPTNGNPPAPGLAGTTVSLFGQGFAANEFVYVLFSTNNAITYSNYVTVAQPVARQVPRTTLVTYADRFTVPPASGPAADVYAVGGTSGATSPHRTFSLVAPAIGLTPSTGNP